jgi:adenylosuccinate lyase
MIERYTRPTMGRIWNEENKFRQWLNVELANCEVRANLGELPAEAAALLRQHASFSVARINEIEKEVRHDVIAFTTAVAESMQAAGHAAASRWFHYGLTSNDVVDTAQALQLKESAALILAGLDTFIATLRRQAFVYKDAVMIGRTHGVHAEPITFGLKIAIWYDEARRARRRLEAAAEDLRVGKLSGAVGNLAHSTPAVEEAICAKLGLRVSPIASQVIARDRHAAFVSALALVTALCETCALEIRHLQRTEVREAEEPFAAGQKGSSAMPHKKNPIVSEQICGLSRVVRANVQAAFEDIALWHERDISHSSVERVILPDSCILADYLLAKTNWLIGNMRVNPERMRRNLDSTHGLVFSGQLLLDLAAAGMLRERGYKIVQGEAMKAWQEEGDFRAAIEAHPEINALLTPEQVAWAFSIERQLKNVDALFARVFGETAPA